MENEDRKIIIYTVKETQSIDVSKKITLRIYQLLVYNGNR